MHSLATNRDDGKGRGRTGLRPFGGMGSCRTPIDHHKSHCRATAMHRRPAGAFLLPRTQPVAVNALGQIVLPHDDLLESVAYERAGAFIGSRPRFLNSTDRPGRQAMSAQSKATHVALSSIRLLDSHDANENGLTHEAEPLSPRGKIHV